jgi:hypothetical protein
MNRPEMVEKIQARAGMRKRVAGEGMEALCPLMKSEADPVSVTGLT